MRVAANTLYSLGQLGLGRLASVATLVALARLQGPDAVGIFSLALTFHIILTGWWVGFDDKVVREIARSRSQMTATQSRLYTWQTVFDYIQLKALIGGLLVALVAGAILLGGWYGPDERWFIVFLLIGSVTDNVSMAVVAGYAGNERFSMALAIIAVQTALRLAFTGWVLFSGVGLLAIALAWLAASLLTAALAFYWLAKHFFERSTADVSSGRAWTRRGWMSIFRLREDWSFAVMGIVVILEYQLDVILLSLFHSAAEVGYYSTATTLFALATLPVQAFRIAVFPMMSRVAVGEGAGTTGSSPQQDLPTVYAWSIVGVLAIALPCALLGFFFAEPVIALVFGPEMIAATVPAQLLMLTVAIFSLNVPHSRFLLATNRQDSAARFITVSAVVNVAANLWLGQVWGAPGAAVARMISTTFFLLLAAWSVRKAVRLPNWRLGMAPVAAAALMAGFLVYASAWLWWMAAAAALVIYGAVAWLLWRTVTKPFQNPARPRA